MKIQNRKAISAFVGISFVFEHLENNRIDNLFNQQLPVLPNKARIPGKIYNI